VLLAPAVEFFEVVLAIHILAVVIGFGAIFAYPVLFAAARRADPAVLPWLFKTMQRIGRTLVNPGLLVVVLAGIYLASHLHQWSVFYVQWGVGAAIVIGAIEGSFMIPREGRLARIAARDVAAVRGEVGNVALSDEYRSTFRQLAIGGALLDLIVIATVFMMAAHIGA
jgi:predicted integral membrane protein DUF2269